MTGDVKTTAARQAQSKADKDALKNLLLGKKRRVGDLNLKIDGETVTLKFQAISSKELDDLRSRHKATAKQIAEGQTINFETFNVELVSLTLIEPELSVDEVKAMFESDAWSAGEVSTIIKYASDICMDGFNIPFSASV